MSDPPVLPGRITLSSPTTPRLEMGPPASPVYTVVPVAGPPGPEGPIGPSGTLSDLVLISGMIEDSVNSHINAPEPHPAYDDIPSLTLLFENRLV